MTMEISVGHSLAALVDEQDFEWLSLVKWHLYKMGRCSTVYASASNPSRFMHRLIVAAPRGLIVDHINGNGLDNRRANLRLCSQSQNSAWGRHKGGKFGYRGVRQTHRSQKYYAQISKDGKRYPLGVFETAAEAAKAYDCAAAELFGEFARLNFPSGGA